MKRSARFKVNDLVMAISSSKPGNNKQQPREKGHIYSVKDTLWCPRCADQKLCIFDEFAKSTHLTECKTCKAVYMNYGKWWTTSKEFVPLTESSIAILAEQEEYEMCATLRSALDALYAPTTEEQMLKR